MSERKLFYAMDENNKRVIVDKLEHVAVKKEGKNKVYFCPFCKEKVVPKMGESKIWHFAHVNKKCDMISSQNNEKLEKFSQKTITSDEITFETDKFTCKLCGMVSNKVNGMNLNDHWICSQCYKTSNIEKLNQFL